MPQPEPEHLVLVSYPGQGHVNPAVALAKRLMRASPEGSRATLCTAAFAHGRMFGTLEEVEEGPITYVPFLVQGYEDGCRDDVYLYDHFLSQLQIQGSRNLSAILSSPSRPPPTRLIYTSFVPWAADVARAAAIPATLYWIQPATVFAVYYHFFHEHGYNHLITSHAGDPSFLLHLPGVPTLKLRDIPSFCNVPRDDPFYGIHAMFKKTIQDLEDHEAREKPTPSVLVNTFYELEPDVISSLAGKIRLIPVGPLLDAAHLIKPNEEAEYIDWLDSKPEGSVVYVSFGSYAMLSKKQLEEIAGALRSASRPYLWVLRSNNRPDADGVPITGDGNGLVVGWCSQARVLSHPAVGCFVTHSGWNSTLEALSSGTPMVCMPLWSDQATNARLVDSVWGTGVVCEADTKDQDGVLPADEIKRCIELVMSGEEMNANARKWRDSAMAAVQDGGSSASHTNLLEFMGDR